MIIFLSVVIKDLFNLGKDYPWTRPAGCRRCGSFRLWGHGFVSAYFDGYHQPFWLKRYRCPDCGCVIRLRPEGYFKGFQASVQTIRSSIASKVQACKWLSGVSRSRQCHWYRSLLRKKTAYLTNTWHQGILAAFDHLAQLGRIPVGRSI